MHGARVDVCIDDVICELCGIAANLAPGTWLAVACDDAIPGNQVKLSNANNFLTFCGIQIYGVHLESENFCFFAVVVGAKRFPHE